MKKLNEAPGGVLAGGRDEREKRLAGESYYFAAAGACVCRRRGRQGRGDWDEITTPLFLEREWFSV